SRADSGLVMRWTIRTRLRRAESRPGDAPGEEDVEIDPGGLSGIFAARGWLRDAGIAAWLLVGIAAFLAGAVWLLALTQTIVVPGIVGAIIASVASPGVDWLGRRRVPRAAGAALVLLAIVALGVAVAVLVLAGVTSQSHGISSQLQDGADRIEGWLK